MTSTQGGPILAMPAGHSTPSTYRSPVLATPARLPLFSPTPYEKTFDFVGPVINTVLARAASASPLGITIRPAGTAMETKQHTPTARSIISTPQWTSPSWQHGIPNIIGGPQVGEILRMEPLPHRGKPSATSSAPAPQNEPVHSTQIPSLSSRTYNTHVFDTTGQIPPPGLKPRVTATLWEDEGSLCFQVEAKGVCVARREDNHMINGTKLLNVAGMTRGRRDGILKSEKIRHVVKIGPMHLKGVWIPFERALDFANKEKITEQLYPLFVHDIGALLYPPSNQTRSQAPPTYQRHANDTLFGTTDTTAPCPDHALPHQSSSDGVRLARGVDRHPVHLSTTSLNPPATYPSLTNTGNIFGRHYTQNSSFGARPAYPTSIPTAAMNIPEDPPPAYSKRNPREQLAPCSYLSSSSTHAGVENGDDDRRDESIQRLQEPVIGRSEGPGSSLPNSTETTRQRHRLSTILRSRKSRSDVLSSKKSGETFNQLVQNKSDSFATNQSAHLNTTQEHPAIKIESAVATSCREAPNLEGRNAGNHANELREEDTLLIRLKDEENMSWGDIARHFSSVLGRVYQVPALQMRLKRVHERLAGTCASIDTGNPRPNHSVHDPLGKPTLSSYNEADEVSTNEDERTEALQPEGSTTPRVNDREATATTTDSYQDSAHDETSEDEIGSDSDRRNRVINSVMMEFYRMFDATFGISLHAGSGHSNSTQNDKSHLSLGSNSASSQSQKRKQDDRDRENEEEGDRDRKRRKEDDAKMEDCSDDEKKLACPYFQHNPRRYRNVHSCLGPGFVTIHRLKEHLYRRHALPPHCTRCCETFSSEADVIAHSRQPDSCQVRDVAMPEGFDKAQAQLLRSRKKGASRSSIPDQWKDIYMILFPDVNSSDVPSPYYDYGDYTQQQAGSSPASAGFARYDAYLRHELPNVVRHEIEKEMEEELYLVDEKLKSRLPLIVRNCLERLCREYQREPSDQPKAVDKSETYEAEPSGASQMIIYDSDLAAFDIPPDVSFPPEALLEIWDDCFPYSGFNGEEPSDSGYGSLDQSTGNLSSIQNGSFGDFTLPESFHDHFQQAEAQHPQVGGHFHDDVEPGYLGKGKAKAS